MSASAARTMPPYQTGNSPIALAGAAGSTGSSVQTARAASPFAQRCPRCTKAIDPALPFCAHCGTRVGAPEATGRCESCGSAYLAGVDIFCAQCGTLVGKRVSKETGPFGALGARVREHGPRLALLDDEGHPTANYVLERGEAVVGRGDADIRFDDVYLSPMHARFEMRDGALWVRDLGSRNGTWSFIDLPTRLSDGDVMLVGSQLLRFRRLGYPGPHPAEPDATRRMGSLVPSADVAVLEQLRADGSVRDAFHLSPARTVQLGRESGDWVFPYDPTMSGRHAEVRSEDAEFFVYDTGSRNGVALAVHGDRAVKKGQRILVGDQILRVESVA
ncbi:MAG: domain containing protein [Gemmatimonadetes bacterium]|nr:domain containing protein [Gemmatimonadota bacterium]